jgi:predicted small metal-binding protein
MRDLHCRDVDLNCEFIAKGDTTEEVLEQAERHMGGVHHMAVTPELKERLRWLTHDQASTMHRDSVLRNS